MAAEADSSTVLAALELAARAPSVHNSQPWQFEVHSRYVDVFAADDGGVRRTDPDGRDLLVSCGIAVHHLRVALRAFGLFPVTTLLPDPRVPDLVARVEHVPSPVTRADLALAACIPRRASDRRPYLDRELDADQMAELVRVAAAHGTALQAVRDPIALDELTTAVLEADAHQRADPGYLGELARWRRRQTTVDGVPDLAGASHEQIGGLRQRWVRRQAVPDTPGGVGTLLVLGTATDDRHARLTAGQAVSAVLLAATRLRLASCALSQPLEVPTARAAVRARVLHHAAHPQLVLRVGWSLPTAAPLPPTGRRPLADSLRTRHP